MDSEGIITRIDSGLSCYYKELNTQYSKLFSEYCEANGFDEDFVGEELEAEPDESAIPDFDEDFPFKTTPKDTTERNQIIMNIVKMCANNLDPTENDDDDDKTNEDNEEITDEPDKYSKNKPKPQRDDEKNRAKLHTESEQKERSDPVDEQEKYQKIAQRLLSTHCSSLFAMELQGDDAKDAAYKTIKSIDIKTQRPIMLFFVDSYCRLRMDKYYIKKEDVDRWGISDFFKEKEKSITTLTEQSDFTLGEKQASLEQLEHGLKSYMKRVLPTMRIKAPLYTICDDLNQYAMYLWGITNYVSIQKTGGIGDQNDMANIYDQSDLVPATIEKPVHIDFMIIPQCTKSTFGSIDDDDYEDDDDFDDDFDDDDVDEKDVELRMGFGGKKENGQPLHEIGDLSKYLVSCGYKKDRDFFVEEIDSSIETFYDHRTIKGKLIGLHHKAQMTNYARLIFVIDRRNPEFVTDSCCKTAYSLDDKQWRDKIYCIKPKKENKMCAEFGYLPESLVHMSQQLILPSNTTQNIGIKNALNGYMFTVSYHIYSAKIVRAYNGFAGQMQRFCIKDICNYWPQLFVKRDSLNQQLKEELLHFAQNAKYADEDFDKFNDFLK